THLQPLGEAVVIRVPRTLDRYWRSDVESASRVHWSKRWRVRHVFQSEKRRIVVLVLVRVTKSGQNIEALQRHPKQVGVEDVLFDLGSPGQINVRVVSATKRRDRFPKCRIPMRTGDQRHRQVI